jgi:hypothetical protein
VVCRLFWAVLRVNLSAYPNVSNSVPFSSGAQEFHLHFSWGRNKDVDAAESLLDSYDG